MIEFGSAAEWAAGAVLRALGFGAAVWQLRASRKDSQHVRLKAARDEEGGCEANAHRRCQVSWKPPRHGPPPDDFDGITPVDVEVLKPGQSRVHWSRGDSRSPRVWAAVGSG